MPGDAGLLEEITALLSAGKEDQARRAMVLLAGKKSDDALTQLEAARLHDRLGYEREAVDYYLRAIELGLQPDDMRDVYLTLGSTYRALGRYDDARRTWLEGLAQFPDADEIRMFLAMVQYNQGEAREAVSALLKLLVKHTRDERMANYKRAIDFYADHLDETWDQ